MKRSLFVALLFFVVASIAGGLLAACASESPDARFVQTSLPDRASFPIVAQLLDRRCGTLDCHGSRARNLRLYGSEGARLAQTDRPLLPVCSTPDEIDQDYLSVVGLEPETMNAVVADHGANPERLTMIRKARGTEHHKGYTIVTAGDDADTCITSWLAGQTSLDHCTRALTPGPCIPAQ